MLAKAPSLPADEILLDLEDSVAPQAKDQARANIVDALDGPGWEEKIVAVRINSIESLWAADDLMRVVEAEPRRLDCIIIPKVEHSHHVMFVDHMLRMIEAKTQRSHKIGIEAQIETAIGLKNVHSIARSSDRLQALIFGPADMSASLGMPGLTAGPPAADYPGDHWHSVLMAILVAARAAGIQAIDGPYLVIEDLDGFRSVAKRARALGYDGKWAVHPSQIDVLNEVFAPTRQEFDRAAAIVGAYERATGVEARGAVMFDNEMIDEASRKMAARIVARGLAGGMKPRAETSPHAE
jgi:citrate lyase subunit beta / citryl-CoA lyase